MPRSRTAEEEWARGRVRSLCARQGTKVRKMQDVEGRCYVTIKPCQLWPEGLITKYNGWRDTLSRLEKAVEHPRSVIGGVFLAETLVSGELPESLQQEDNPHEVLH